MNRSELGRLVDGDAFLWATGIEDTFIPAPWPATGRTLDEYELTGHYHSWREDLDLMASLGVTTVRYGIPWHRLNPSPARWDWAWVDRSLEGLLERGIDPIVDLVHYGVPPWLDGAFLHPDFPARMADYAARVAERYRGRIHAFTPLNEPRITAWYCGKLGWWPPYLRGWRGFVDVMVGLCRGIVATCRALRSVAPEIVLVHVDAGDRYSSADATLAAEAERRQQIGFLALDLVSGWVGEDHPLWAWLIAHGAAREDVEHFAEQGVEVDVVGINLYPMFSDKRLVRSARGLRTQMHAGEPALVERIGKLYWERYRRPLMITETAARGTVARRRRWLDGSVAAVRRLREQGIPLVGYTWWPMFALVGWAYRQGRRPLADYLVQMGLWDLEPAADGALVRRQTPLVDAYRALVAGQTTAVGPLGRIGADWEQQPSHV